MSYLWIFLGGGFGSILRFALNGLVTENFGETFPWGTLIINVTGSFFIGFFGSLTESRGRWMVPPQFRQFVMVGICGGYTTFSSFSLQTLKLAQGGEWFKAGANATLSLVLCLTAVWLGHVLAMSINSMKGN